MKAQSRQSAQRALIAFALLAALGVGVAIRAHNQRAAFLVDEVTQAVPAAKPFFQFRGTGFSAQKNGIRSATSSLAGQQPRRTIAIAAPKLANGEFAVSAATTSLATVRLLGASPRKATLEHHSVTYRSAYPGVDVIAVRDPERFELSYVFREPRRFADVAFELGSLRDGEIKEDGDGSLTVSSTSGQPRLRVARPVAVDAKGTTRLGRYHVESQVVRVALEMEDLVPPIVLDPVLYIPYWTLMADGRQPGAVTYHQGRGSRETQVALNPKSGKPWLIRPVRSQQSEDRRTQFGELYNSADFPPVSALPRTPGGTGHSASTDQLLDWQRTYFAQSETWEWSGLRWSLLPQTGLPGLIDPALAYAPGSQKLIAFGGATPEFFCTLQSSSLTYCGPELFSLKNGTSLYENDGSAWVSRGLSGAPRPRLRPGMSTFLAGVLVFGGRAMAIDTTMQVPDNRLGASNEASPPFPDSLATDLLNDTWLFDGSSWKSVAAANPPPAQEQAKLVYDSRRKRAVLIGGNSVPKPETASPPVLGLGTFSLWEFDGVDWIQRFEPGDSRLPESFKLRRGVAAVWHPVRQSTILFGGFVDVLDSCPYAGAALAQQRAAASVGTAAVQQAAKQALMAQGCMPGYAHDTWEWDGSSLKQLTQAAFDQVQPRRIISNFQPTTIQQPVYRQVSGAVPPPSAGGSDNLSGATQSHLWPFRYDSSGNHFPLRSALERAYSPPAVSAPVRKDAGSAQAAAPVTQINFVSPSFGASSTPQLSFDPQSGRVLIFANDGRVFDTDLTSWVDRTPSQTPFDAGQNELFAAAWDTARQRIVLFDPTTGITWEGTDSGAWVKASTTGPGVWSVDSTIRTVRDLDTAGLLQLPKMSYDRARARATMIYRNGLWEYDAASQSWTQAALPPALSSCTAATMSTFDGSRARTVVVGCTVPGQTWEWNGSSWSGPFPGPFVAPIRRGDDAPFQVNTNFPYDPSLRWQGTLQLPWAHANALVESATLGGVATLDADGRMQVWNGSVWSAGPGLSEGHLSDAAAIAIRDYSAYGLQYGVGFINDFDGAANTFSLPLVEDYSGNRLLAFRDGATGLRELRFADPAEQRRWQETELGAADPIPIIGGLNVIHTGPNGPLYPKRVNPHPFELLSAEHLTFRALSNPATRTDWNGNPKGSTVGDELVNNLYWPFRLLADPVAHRVRVLTQRGAIWELGSESVQTLGGPCVTENDCEGGSLCEQGVCCFSNCDGLCRTCNGAHPGTCEAKPAGSVCQAAKCSNGVLTAVAQCSSEAQCSYSGQGQACPGDLACADLVSCKTHCSSAADCRDPNMKCSSDGNSCVPNVTCKDGALFAANGGKISDCPGKLACADPTSCRTQCTTRSDCAGGIAACSASGDQCIPDHVTEVAATLGVAPTTWKPEVQRTRADIVASLLAGGFTPDEKGRFIFEGMNSAGLELAFDPNLYDPTTGLRSCATRINVCFERTSQLDACVAGSPRCVSSTPWKNDPGGEDCCPESCLLEYFEKRASMSASAAIVSMVRGTCYPGLKALLEGKQP